MSNSIDEQVVDFYYELFNDIFSEPFKSRIQERLKRDAVLRQVQESAGAASQSLTRFFLNQELQGSDVREILQAFTALRGRLELENIANPNVTPEAIADDLLVQLPLPETVKRTGQDPVYRVALHSVIQVLMLVGPVMAEWRRLNFSSTFELPRRVVNRLNQISEQIDALGRSGITAADERFEITYRDYLLQRFHRVEAGTVRMTTNLDVDLRELFVMPRVVSRTTGKTTGDRSAATKPELMDLDAAREFFGGISRGLLHRKKDTSKRSKGITALDQVKRYPRNIIIGAPGSGKSTFLEWLQLRLASVEEELVLAGQQAVPMLLRVRQLDAQNLPRGRSLIEYATASKDRATLMPPEWVDRQMKQGRFLFMLDGLDETEPELRDRYVIPWLQEFVHAIPTLSLSYLLPPRRLSSRWAQRLEVCRMRASRLRRKRDWRILLPLVHGRSLGS